jgi:8-oxo-dGTP diphosphatase
MIEVVAALIWDENRFLICRRPEHKARPLLWEFPGGKVEPGESMEKALIRECFEELGIVLAVGSVFCDTVYAYDDITIHLTVLNAVISEGKLQLLEHADLRWIKKNDIMFYSFCPADAEIMKWMG